MGMGARCVDGNGGSRCDKSGGGNWCVGGRLEEVMAEKLKHGHCDVSNKFDCKESSR